jgi:hypothetical protein
MPRSGHTSFQLKRGLATATDMGLVLYSQIRLSTVMGGGNDLTWQKQLRETENNKTILKHPFLSTLTC